ncbi:hypothetical protein G6F48_013744 [Rhizopus delemar]|nr:hypothetical protein G6F48_013744 [Rhizopus delemar]
MLVCWMFIILIVKWSLFWYIQSFNPWNPDLLRDPKYANLPESDRAAKCTEVHQARLVRALQHIRESVRPAVARSFFVKVLRIHKIIVTLC